MTDGKGGVEATAVMPDPLVQIGKADLPFTVSKEATPPPAPSSRQSVLPFTGLTYPSELALDAAGAAYLSDTWNDRVLKLAAGSNEQTMLPVTGLKAPAMWPSTPQATSTSPTATTTGCSNLLRRTRSGNSYGLIALTTTADVKIGRERPPRSPLAARSHVVVLWTFT